MRKVGVWFVALLFLASGILHFVTPEFFVALMPPNWPNRSGLNAFAGVLELVAGVGFFARKTRKVAGYIICGMLVCFWVLHGIHLVHPPNPALPFYAYLIRFLLQPVLIFLVWKLKDFPKETV